MYCTHCATAIPDGSNFCMSCGTSAPSTAPSPSAPENSNWWAAGQSTATPPAAAASASADADRTVARPPGQVIPTVSESTKSAAAPENHDASGRRRWLLPALGVGLVIGLVGAAAFVWLRGDDAVSTAGYRGPNSDLVILERFDDDGEVSIAIARPGEPETEFFEGSSASGASLVTDTGFRNSAAEAGAPALYSLGDGDEWQLAVVDPDTGDLTELIGGDDPIDASFAASSSLVLAIETSGSSQRCYAGPISGPLERITRADRCEFSSDGRYVIELDDVEFDDEGQREEGDFRILDLAGATVLQGASVDTPIILPGKDQAITRTGSERRSSLVISDLTNGEVIRETDVFDRIRLLDWDLGDRLMVASQDAGDPASLTIIPTTTAATSEIITHEGSLAAGFLVDREDEVIVQTFERGESTVSIARRSTEGFELEEIASGPDNDVRVADGGDRDGMFVVATGPEDGGEDGVVYLSGGTDIIEFDVDDFASLGNVRRGADSEFVYLEVSTFDGDSSAKLFRARLDLGEIDEVIEDWSNVFVADLTNDGSGAIVIGREDFDDESVVAEISAQGDVDILDEADNIRSAVYDDNEGAVLFTVDDGGDVETLTISIDDGSRAEVLYEDYAIDTVGWNSITPSASSPISRFEGLEPSVSCDDDVSDREVLRSDNGFASGFVRRNGAATFCLDVTDGAFVTVAVNSSADTEMSIAGQDFFEFSDDANGRDPEISQFFEAGSYEVTIRGVDGASGDFTISTFS